MKVENNTAQVTPSLSPYLLEIVRSDPFARFLRRIGLSPISFGLFVFVYGIIRNLVLPAIFGHLFTVEIDGKIILGVLNDWPVLVNELIMVPVVAGYYLWQPITMQTLYDGISERIGPSHLARARAMEYIRPIRWPGWAIVAFLIAVLEASFIHDVFLSSKVLIWENVNIVMLASSFLVRFVVFYMIVYITVRQVFTIIGLNRFFSDLTVKIAPLHPDRAGGLRILGDYVLSTGLIIGVLGLYFGMGFLRRELNPLVITAEFYILLVIYFLLAPLFFFLPLLQVHRRMNEAKKVLLIEIAQQFDIEYRKLLDGLKRDQVDSNHVLRVETIQKIYKIAEGSPEWPFNLEIVSKYTAAIVLPVLIPGIAELIATWLFR